MKSIKNTNKSIKDLKIAVVHDDFIQKGGAEKLIFDIILEFKNRGYDVTVFSSLFSKEWKMLFDEEKILINESFLKFFPGCYLFSKYFFLFDLFNLAFQSFNFDKFDVALSSSTRYGHSIITKPSTFHISYINSPPRAVWFPRSYFFKKGLLYFLFKDLFHLERLKDFRSQYYSNIVVTNSENIYKRYLKNYKRNSIILNPFIELNDKNLQLQKDYYVVISRLVPWKRIEYVIKAFNKNGLDLYVIGDGSDKKNLENTAYKNIRFLGYIPNSLKNEYLSHARALVFPQEEDFGLTLIESLSYGVPVIYFNKGGAKDILNKKYGTPFDFQTPESLNEAININNNQFFDRNILLNYSKKFSKDSFFNKLERLILNKFK